MLDLELGKLKSGDTDFSIFLLTQLVETLHLINVDYLGSKLLHKNIMDNHTFSSLYLLYMKLVLCVLFPCYIVLYVSLSAMYLRDTKNYIEKQTMRIS